MEGRLPTTAVCVFETAKGVASNMIPLRLMVNDVPVLINTLVGETHWTLVSISVVDSKNTEENE